MTTPRTHKIELILDDDDYRDVQAEIARRQAEDHQLEGFDKGMRDYIRGGSNLAGYYLADACRLLAEYRAIWEREHGGEA